MNRLLKVKCPQCEIEFPYYESESRPFCSERCKMIDLGHWFQESYKVPVKEMMKTEESTSEKNFDEESNEEVPIDEESYDENDY